MGEARSELMRTAGRACTRLSLVGDLGHELILFVSYPHERNKRTAVHLATERTEMMPQLALYGYTRYWLAWRTARGALLACTCRRAGALAALCEKVAGRRAASLAELRT
jgi:hypothetical protein